MLVLPIDPPPEDRVAEVDAGTQDAGRKQAVNEPLHSIFHLRARRVVVVGAGWHSRSSGGGEGGLRGGDGIGFTARGGGIGCTACGIRCPARGIGGRGWVWMACGGAGGGARGRLPHDGGVRQTRPVRAGH